MSAMVLETAPSVQIGACRSCGSAATCRLGWTSEAALRVLGPPEVAGVAGPWCEACGASVASGLDQKVRLVIGALSDRADGDPFVQLQPLNNQ